MAITKIFQNTYESFRFFLLNNLLATYIFYSVFMWSLGKYQEKSAVFGVSKGGTAAAAGWRLTPHL